MNYLTSTDGVTGLFGIFICIIFFLVTFIATKDQDTGKSLAYSSFVSGVMALLLRIAGLVTTKALLAFVVLVAIAAIYYKLQDE